MESTHHAASARAAIEGALARPPQSSDPDAVRLIDRAAEVGPGGHALALLEQVDIAALNAHDRVRLLTAVCAQGAWFEAFQTIALAAVTGPTTGWPEDEVTAIVHGELDDLGLTDPANPEHARAENMARCEAWETRERAIALEVSLASRVSPRTAGRRVDSSRFMAEAVPEALVEAWAGRWGYGHLRVIEKELAEVPDELRAAVLGDVLPHAATDHPRRLNERIRKAIARRDADGMAERSRAKSAERDVGMWTLSDGQSRLAITGPHELIAGIHREVLEIARARKAYLDAHPDESTPEERRIGAVRVDAVREAVTRLFVASQEPGELIDLRAEIREGNLADVVHNPADREGNLADAIHNPSDREGNLASAVHNPSDREGNLASAVHRPVSGVQWPTSASGSPGSRPRAEAAIIIDLATALGMADEPGYLPGYGWIPAEISRELLADAPRWRRWLIDDTSRQLMEVGRHRYRPSQALRDLITARDITCTADTCTRPAAHSQLDHAIDFDGHNTSPENLHAVCGPDHLAVTAGHFIIGDDSGRTVWHSTRTQHDYPSHPHPLYAEPPEHSPESATAPRESA